MECLFLASQQSLCIFRRKKKKAKNITMLFVTRRRSAIFFFLCFFFFLSLFDLFSWLPFPTITHFLVGCFGRERCQTVKQDHLRIPLLMAHDHQRRLSHSLVAWESVWSHCECHDINECSEKYNIWNSTKKIKR